MLFGVEGQQVVAVAGFAACIRWKNYPDSLNQPAARRSRLLATQRFSWNNLYKVPDTLRSRSLQIGMEQRGLPGFEIARFSDGTKKSWKKHLRRLFLLKNMRNFERLQSV